MHARKYALYVHASTRGTCTQVRIQQTRKYAFHRHASTHVPDPELVKDLRYCRIRYHLAVDLDFCDDREVIPQLASEACPICRSRTNEGHLWLGLVHVRFLPARGVLFFVPFVRTRNKCFVLVSQYRITLLWTYSSITIILVIVERINQENDTPFAIPFFIRSKLRASPSSGYCTASSKVIRSVSCNLCSSHSCKNTQVRMHQQRKYACINNASTHVSTTQVRTRTKRAYTCKVDASTCLTLEPAGACPGGITSAASRTHMIVLNARSSLPRNGPESFGRTWCFWTTDTASATSLSLSSCSSDLPCFFHSLKYTRRTR